MKNIAKIMTFLLVFLCFSPIVLAADNVFEIIDGSQDYLILGTVVDINDTYVVLEHYQTVGADEDSLTPLKRNENISIDKFRYSYCDEHSDISVTPRLGDNVFISVNRNGKNYTMANGAYKISSVDYKMLTFFVSEDMKNQDCMADIMALAYFVRTNGEKKDFAFENDTLTTIVDGKKITLYPTENITEMVTFLDNEGNIVEAAVTKDVIIHGDTAHVENGGNYRWVFACVILLFSVVLGGFVTYKLN